MVRVAAMNLTDKDLRLLDTLLAARPAEIAMLCRSLLAVVGARPDLAGAVKTGWGSINFRHERAGHVCAVFPHADRVSLYFEHGRLLEDPDGLLMGELKKGRFLRLYPGDRVPEDAIGVFIAQAIALFS